MDQSQGSLRHRDRQVDDALKGFGVIDSIVYLNVMSHQTETHSTLKKFLWLFKRKAPVRVFSPLMVNTLVEFSATGMDQTLGAKDFTEFNCLLQVLKDTEDLLDIDIPAAVALIPESRIVESLWQDHYSALFVTSLSEDSLQKLWGIIAKKTVAEEY